MKTSLLLLFVFVISIGAFCSPTAFVSHSARKPITLVYDANDEKTVEIAVNAFAGDLELLTGVKPIIATSVDNIKGDIVIVGTVGNSHLVSDLFNKKAIDIQNVTGKWEVYGIDMVSNYTSQIKKALVVYGSDKRGAAYGVFSLSEKIGVSPWHWWADVVPEKQKEVKIAAGSYVSQVPSVKYRGIFLNDECWGLNPWATKIFEPEEGNIGPKSYAAIFELLLRLRANFIWPAMHPCTNAFYTNPQNPKVAHDYGIVVGTSHAEPMLRNNVDEWDGKTMGEYNFFTNKETILKLLG